MRPSVRAWFDRRTSAGGDWERRELVRRKQGTRVSAVLPARDEEATIGAIVTGLVRELMEEVPLIDEVLVVDSGCSDRTGEVARRAGATVVRQGEVLPHLGDRPGKGEALWKSVHAADGDVLAFIDADLRDFDPQFAVGLLGPLLTDPGVSFVKGFYDRPLDTGATVLPAGGGRVTELLARPLLNLHYPDLAGIVQPLAGEYAVRRGLAEQLPFVSGYGVEIAMLVDVLHLAGLDSIAQVDLGVRCHRNSGDDVLGRMAAQVYLALLSRLQRHGQAVMTTEPATELTQFYRDDNRFLPNVSDISVGERPPMATIAEYRQQRAVARR